MINNNKNSLICNLGLLLFLVACDPPQSKLTNDAMLAGDTAGEELFRDEGVSEEMLAGEMLAGETMAGEVMGKAVTLRMAKSAAHTKEPNNQKTNINKNTKEQGLVYT